MFNLENVLLGLLVVDALALIVLVLIQQGKGADVGAAFGSGGSNTMFGSAGSGSFLSRTTTWLSVGFFLISFGLAYTAKERAASVGTLGIPTVSAPEVPASAPEIPQVAPELPQGDVPDAAVLSGGTSTPTVGPDGTALDGIGSDGVGLEAVTEGVTVEGALDSVVPDLPDGAELQNSLESIESTVQDAVESVDSDIPQ